MSLQISNELKEYKVPDNLMDRFQNIMTFSKNMVLKDSKHFEEYEDDVSRWFGKMLIKYFDEELTDDDILSILTFVADYNKEVDECVKDEIFKLSTVYGLLGINKDILDEITTELNSASQVLKSGDSESGEKYLVLKNYVKVFENSSYFKSSFINMVYLRLNRYLNSTEYEYYNNDLTLLEAIFKYLFENKTLICRNIDGIDISSKKVGVEFLLNKFESEINKLETALANSLKFLITNIQCDYTNTITDKRTASDIEKSCAENGENIIIFDIKIFNKKIENLTDKLMKKINDAFKIEDLKIIRKHDHETNIQTIDSFDISFQLAYKELNLAYRDVLESEITDVATSLCWADIRNNLSEKKFSISKDILKSLRLIYDNILITDIYNEDNEIIGTTKLFKYRYTNAYICRRSAENDMISYYLGDNYISNGYGTYSYQKQEIGQFIDIYKETREYFYKVLLNEAFAYEEEYPLYEKMYIIFLSVVRFMDAKLDTIKDIETFTREDIENFLTSFGLGSLADILTVSNFQNSEIYAKELIKRYISLVKNKGSKEVINVLQDAFSLNNTELTIYKNIIVGDKSFEYDDANNITGETKKYRFIKSKYDTTNQMKNIIENVRSANTVAGVTSADKYWNADNTPDGLLEKLGLNVSGTKYLISEISNELSSLYINTRILFELVDFIYNNDGSNGDDINSTKNIKIEIGDYFSGSLIDAINSLRYLWAKYLQSLKNDMVLEYSKNDYTYHIKENVHKIKIPEKTPEKPKICQDFEILNKLYEYLETDKTDDNRFLDLTKLFDINVTSNDELNQISLKPKVLNIITSGYDISENMKVEISNYLMSIMPIVMYSKYKSFSFYYLNPDVNPDDRKNYLFDSATANTFIKDVIRGGRTLVNDLVNGRIYKNCLPSPIINMLICLFYHIFFSKGEYDAMVIDTKTKGTKDYFTYDEYKGNTNKTYSDYINNSVNVPYYFSTELCNLNDKADMKKGIITICNELSDIFDVMINLNLSARDDVMINFLKTAIEYFISYTTEMLNFSYKNTYKSYLESPNISDKANTTLKYKEVDSFYYDESLTIDVKENENGGE